MPKISENTTIYSTMPEIFPMYWASDWGEDQYGLWMSFTYQNITQTFRWIKPGKFIMGSPEDEPERDGPETEYNEAAHEVTLTKGFWLADTACTQELWQAVMGNNPSQFKGEKLPVEQVSWNDCNEFLRRISHIPEFQICLPTEAQWEYACRAGTTTPFYFGENITPNQVNYNGNRPYNNNAKGIYREQTVEVKSLPCNSWGLYQMHGNVWEWCSDYYGDYPSDAVTDPIGPNSGSGRVLRGGGWGDSAWNARSACRYGYTPDDDWYDHGFRFALGQKMQVKGK